MAIPSLDYIFNHVFLPTRLPHADDHDTGAGDRALVGLLSKAATRFRDLNDHHHYNAWSTICRMLQNFASLHEQDNVLSKHALRDAMRAIKDGGMVVLHVAMQNSCLILQKCDTDYTIETFEVSPPAADVLAASTALQWEFPSRAVIMPQASFEDDKFEDSFVEFLEKASNEQIPQYVAQSRKANFSVYESRDTTSPAMIGQLLMAILEANGRKHSPRLTRKRIRDDVCWSDGALNPWRRSSTWLALRVSLQRCLCFLLGSEVGTVQYKFFMAYVLLSSLQMFCKQDTYPSDRLLFAKAKVCRRVAKLERLKDSASTSISSTIRSMMPRFKKDFHKVVEEASQQLEGSWERSRANAIRKIVRLPQRAQPKSTVLSLPHSGTSLNQILQEALNKGRSRAHVQLEKRYRQSAPASAFRKMQLRNTTSLLDYLDLADEELRFRSAITHQERFMNQDLDNYCDDLVFNMRNYQTTALSAYRSDPERLSLMIITIMELWVALDTAALRLYPMLAEYQPGFPPDLLHPLQVLQIEGMTRVWNIEQYLKRRGRSTDKYRSSIFGSISVSSFAVRYFDQCSDMQDRYDHIRNADASAKSAKEAEYAKSSTEHSRTLEKRSTKTCLYVQNDAGDRIHDKKACSRCYLQRVAKRIKIDFHEAMLPSEDVQAKAVVFELLLPRGFAAWRDGTWQILKLARSLRGTSQQAHFLMDFPGLARFAEFSPDGITLASRVKSFRKTHYESQSFPTRLSKICVPHGCKYGYYDQQSNVWTSDHEGTPSFANICSPGLPQQSVFFPLRKFVHPTFEGTTPSANEVVVSQISCPSSMTELENTTFQALRLGSSILWVNLLREIASSNLNFGTLEVGILVEELALVLGPSIGNSTLRANHLILGDYAFCTALLKQIQTRLQDIAANWRESQIAQCMTLLLQRLWTVTAPGELKLRIEDALMFVRRMAQRWTRLLRKEIGSATDIETSQKRSQDALMAAFIARKTFVIEASRVRELLSADAVTCFLECAFTLKENLPKSEAGHISNLEPTLKRLFLADLSLVHALETTLRNSIETYNWAVSEAVDSVWENAGPARNYTPWTSVSASHTGWIAAQVRSDNYLLEQIIHIDLLEGILLIDGQPLSRLPDEYTKEDLYQQLFGSRMFLTCPSSVPEMSYRLAALEEQHEIHLGYRNGTFFVRVRIRGHILELIPPTLFQGKGEGQMPDLPLALIRNCVHWLDLETHSLEVRPFKSKWRKKASNWTVDLRLGHASRNRNSQLVDPHSHDFNLMVDQIQPFEERAEMVVFQPRKVALSIELPRLELSFRVNDEGLLHSQQLRAVMDKDQDCGTLYGLQSSLVVCNDSVPEERSVLVALGPASVTLNRVTEHVNVKISHTGFYARFNINENLKRLESAPESRFTYFKAYLHAITSHIMPDPLTSKTGTDEAISCLVAGNAQPWAPLDTTSYTILDSIAGLTPQRTYYPEKLKVLQKIVWRNDMIPPAQHDAFRPLVNNIIEQCRSLRPFYPDSVAVPAPDRRSAEHLLTRATVRNQPFRPMQELRTSHLVPDAIYVPRDCSQGKNFKNAFDITVLLKHWVPHILVSSNLADSLNEQPLIQGFDRCFDLPLLSDLVDLNVAAHWGPLFKLCQSASESLDKHKLMFLFATVAFGRVTEMAKDMGVLRSLCAIAIMTESKNIEVPQYSVFTDFRYRQTPDVETWKPLLMRFKISYPGDERKYIPPAKMNPSQRQKLELAEQEHERESRNSCEVMALYLMTKCPCEKPSSDELEDLPLFEPGPAYTAVEPEWERLYANFILTEHLQCVQKVLNSCQLPRLSPSTTSQETKQKYFTILNSSCAPPTLRELIQRCTDPYHNVYDACEADRTDSELGSQDKLSTSDTTASGNQEIDLQSLIRIPESSRPSLKLQNKHLEVLPTLQEIVKPFTDSEDLVRQNYGKNLEDSMSALATTSARTTEGGLHPQYSLDEQRLSAMILSARDLVSSRFLAIRKVLLQGYEWLERGGMMPSITPCALLQALSLMEDAPHLTCIDPILEFAHSLVSLQHLQRIHSAHVKHDIIQLASELNPRNQMRLLSKEQIHWLLLEIDFDFLIREDQYRVAQAMVAPYNKNNFVLQMNMGRGKSSVIIPMIVADMANGRNLARVVVPRALLLQMAQLLQYRLGGLIGRTVKHIPFSRKTSTEMANLDLYRDLHHNVLASKGVVLTLPDHMLSFKLSGLQELSNGHLLQASFMIDFQQWLSSMSRDVMDECDQLLAVKTQLIYPSGSQSMVDGHPSRWTTVEELLRLVQTHLKELSHEYPNDIEVVERVPGTFPTIYLLNSEVKEALIRKLADNVSVGDGGAFSLHDGSSEEADLIGRFLRENTFPRAIAAKVAGVFTNNLDARQRLLLLRGHLVHELLLMGLSKRWNVQYGIDPRRAPIAVPFHSKGMPSDQAEFGHPDVSILLTCLSFYYSGLSLPQLQQTLGHLLKSDEPTREFDLWIREIKSFPASLKSWKAINVHDEAQTKQLWTFLRYQMTVVNYFLNTFVFPRHAKTFERKLVSSGWDMATQRSSELKQSIIDPKENFNFELDDAHIGRGKDTSITVGFSGTNDNRSLLPLNIVQNDLPGLSHINAEVLTYLLQKRNSQYIPAWDENHKRLSERDLLESFTKQHINVFLDAGAQILELDNVALARLWLGMRPEMEAAVFFGEGGHARVIHRGGKEQALAGSPYANNLILCLVYLDEAHTRGVDLKMPADAKAALTLGMMQTKDHTVQAAMRLRQLGISQSVVFFAPPEVHQSILNFRGKTNEDKIDSGDVVGWLLEQTCCNIEQLQPLYISQGMEYCRKFIAAHRNPDATSSAEQRKDYLKVLELPEQYSLEALYSPDHKTKSTPVDATGFLMIAEYLKKLDTMKQGLRNTGDAVQVLAHQEVEQEREIQIEVETVQEVKRPLRAKALTQPPLHEDVKTFAETASLVVGSEAYRQAYSTLRQTALGRRLGISHAATGSKLFTSQDFDGTIVNDGKEPRDEYSRPVHWILWSDVDQTALICSPFEADALLPYLRTQSSARVYLISYAAPVTKTMLIFDTLKFFSVPTLPEDWHAPAWLVRDLGIFAGRLYFDFDNQYQETCVAMGILPSLSKGVDSVDFPELGQGTPEKKVQKHNMLEPFCPTPLLFMQEWLAIRRKGQDFSQTMMGELCQGKRLIKEDIVEEAPHIAEVNEAQVEDDELDDEGDESDEEGDGVVNDEE